MNAPATNTESDAMMRCRSTLRWLVIVEILLNIFAAAVSVLQAPLLPSTLQQFESETSDRFGTSDILFLCVFVLMFIAIIIAWLALLCGWRWGRIFYTATWIAAFQFLFVAGPIVQSALLSTVETAATLVGGLILGYLYFSDIRRFYEQPRNASLNLETP